MTDFLSADSVRSIANGQASMPEVDDDGMIILRSSEPEGSFSSTSVGKSFKYELNLPANFGELSEKGELTIFVETKGSWTFLAPRKEPLLVKINMNNVH